MIYDDWFPEKPSDWIKVGDLQLNQKRITPASKQVEFYAIGPDAARKFIEVLRAFQQDNPPGSPTNPVGAYQVDVFQSAP